MKKFGGKYASLSKLFVFLSCIALAWLSGYYAKEAMKPKEPVRIAISSWVGYLPIIYAIQKNWLSESDIELLWNGSLEISASAYDRHLVDGMFATQYDLALAGNEVESLFAFGTNLSNGDDVIMSNVSLDEIKKSNNIIANFEQNSLGQAMFNSFIKKYKLNANQFLMANKTQAGIASSDAKDKKVIAITYPPFAQMIEKNGFKVISNSTDLNITVLDGLFITKETDTHHHKTILKIKDAFEKASLEATANPTEFYATVKPYISDMSYKEFIGALNGIAFINKANTLEVNKIITKHGIKMVEY